MSKVTMLVGIPGCGKSTYARKLRSNTTIVVCPDDIRKDLYGDISYQGDPTLVFETVDSHIRSALNANCDVIYDATNTTMFREKTVEKLRSFGATEVDAVIFDTPFNVCVERNNTRKDRLEPVPLEVIKRMHDNMKNFTDYTYFDSVTYVRY